MSLPNGWTATLSRTWTDPNTAPVLQFRELMISGPNGVSFKVISSIPAHDAAGLTDQQVVSMLWDDYEPYALSAIAAINTMPALPVTGVSSVPVIFP